MMIINNVTIVDAPCGTGKTSWVFQNINEHPDESYIYCTPYLDEISRIKNVCGKYRFKEPLPYTGTKIDDLNRLLSSGDDIAVSHVTFLNATPETMDLLENGRYTLIIDEALEVITEFNKAHSIENAPRQSMSKDDIKLLLDKNLIRIDENYKVQWSGEECGSECKFSEVERFANLGRLYCVDNKLLLTVFPPEIFKCFDNVYVLTYMFDSSILKYYFDMFGIDYNLKSVVLREGRYSLENYSRESDVLFRNRCKSLITIHNNSRMNDYKRATLSQSWYSKGSGDERLNRLKNDIGNYFNRCIKEAKASDDEIMWTCFGEYEPKLKGAGYTKVRALNKEERRLPKEQKVKAERALSCFVPCNAKATNIYRNRWALAYCVNMYVNPMIRRFFEDHNCVRSENGLQPIVLNQDLFALSCLIQWIFRSRIRDGKPIYIYIPNKRMRDLLAAWLDNRI